GGAVAGGRWGRAPLLVAMLIMSRNAYGAATLVVCGGVVVGLSLYASPGTQAAFGYAITWFLLFGAVRPVGELWRQRRRREGRYSHPAQVARLPPLRTGLWGRLFGLATLGALAGGALLVLTRGERHRPHDRRGARRRGAPGALRGRVGRGRSRPAVPRRQFARTPHAAGPAPAGPCGRARGGWVGGRGDCPPPPVRRRQRPRPGRGRARRVGGGRLHHGVPLQGGRGRRRRP